MLEHEEQDFAMREERGGLKVVLLDVVHRGLAPFEKFEFSYIHRP